MAGDGDQDKIRTRRFARLAIASVLLLAFFWPLGEFFFWIFAGASVYFVFLSIYYKPRPAQASRSYEQPRSRSAQFTSHQPASDVKNKLKIIAIAVGGFIFFILFVLMIIGFIVGEDPTPELSTESEISADRVALASNPNDINALTNIGNQFYANAQYDSAERYYDRVLQIDAQNSSAMFNKALVYYQVQNYNKSIEWSRKCISMYPDNVDAYTLMGDNYYTQKNYNEAIGWYRQAYEKGARNSELLNIMAFIYDEQNNRSEAIRLYKETLQQDSSLVEVYDRLAKLEPGNAGKYKALADRWR